MQANDTAYPRLKTHFTPDELACWYTPTPEERAFCLSVVRGKNTRFSFLLALKSFQRLGYFVTSDKIPGAIINHLIEIEKLPVNPQTLAHYDVSRSRKTHRALIRSYLNVKSFEGSFDEREIKVR